MTALISNVFFRRKDKIIIMIRKMIKSDINDVAEIWLDTNLKAHNFISPCYWLENFEKVKNMFSEAEIYVHESDSKINGFIGLNDDYIEGVFVRSEKRSNGIGKQLLEKAKEGRTHLNLNVYKQNERAVRFYLREGFNVIAEGMDSDTNEKDYLMIWQE